MKAVGWGRADRYRPAVAVAAGVFGLLAAAAAVATLPATSPAVATTGTSMTRPVALSRLAERSVLLDVAAAGKRLVAVGERGRVLLSDDAGLSWRQSSGVPVSVTLTALCFVDGRRGWAVGHGGVILHTVDAGDTWTLQLDGIAAARQAAAFAASRRPLDPALTRSAELLVADGPDKPFLAVLFTSPENGIAVGAYGLIFSTDDGGANWHPRMADADNPRGLHLNAVFAAGSKIYLAGERGLLLRSDDGRRFAALASPYDGSWFAAAASPARGMTLAGLRGNVFNSKDEGATWQKVEGAGGETISSARQVGDNLLLVSQAGRVYALDAELRLTVLDVRLPPTPVTALIPAAEGVLVATTLRGPARVSYSLGLPAGR